MVKQIKINIVHHQVPTKYIIIETIYDVIIQNNNVQLNLLLLNSPFAVATVAKHGIVNILNDIKEINPGIPIPVA